MKILIACECSGRVRDAFKAKGHYAVRLPAEERRTLRSKTFPGIADAMSTQWGIE